MSKTVLKTSDTEVCVNVKRNRLIQSLKRDKYLYLLLAPGIIYFIIFRYIPMWGVTIAFKDFNMFKGYFASPWVGFDNFIKLFKGVDFMEKFSNTLIISSLKLLFGFPAPIILALLLNELTNIKFKKTVQTILYLPHFISWVVLAGIIVSFVNPSDGVINYLIKGLG
ncbi:MAG: carbohydrate transporter rane protein 1, family, partial [Clostridiales bacterium]|nr:carbohydrate transporter rane protein 1, family [Clostridiales bacterium]